MQQGYYVIRTYESGSVGEKTKFFVPGVRPVRMNREQHRNVKKMEQNEHSAEKRLARLINANFRKGDILLGLDYNEEGMQRLYKRALEIRRSMSPDEYVETEDILREAAEQELRCVIRRVKYELSKLGLDPDLMYVAITSDMDGETGESVRVHHHLIIPEEALEVFKEKWQAIGSVEYSPLSAQVDYTPIAAYFIRQVRHTPDIKKYMSSRNLVRPEPKDRIAIAGSELRVPQGGELLHRNEYKPGRPQYIRYVLPLEKRNYRPRQKKE